MTNNSEEQAPRVKFGEILYEETTSISCGLNFQLVGHSRAHEFICVWEDSAIARNIVLIFHVAHYSFILRDILFSLKMNNWTNFS